MPEPFLNGSSGAPPGEAELAPTVAASSGPETKAAQEIEKLGGKIGHYKLLQPIGEGGCGVVYMAEQEEPVRRRVALKVIKLGMDTKSVIARFEAERQALAMMDHPNIAKVFDAGATETGRPYFVMELVRGTKITEYCDQNQLSTAERLQLFMHVCSAVQHAHQKGIIHRDLKPSNVLVTPNDPDRLGVPKVIDFGIAKATGQQLTDKTLFTEFNQFVGTPAYMSPEQAGRSAQDIDTRSDIYSLGVLLYELLTSKTPFDPRALLERGLEEMLRALREEEPPKPSTRLSTMLKGDLASTAQRRQIEPPKLVHLVRGDLDWIVMKCLEKDRTRRYETANGLAMDLRRHLSNEPVLARPPSSLYRFQKLIHRNKVAFAAAGAVALALVLGAVGSTWQAIRATYAERAQSRLRQEAEQARAGEAQERATAEHRLYDSLLGEARATRIARHVGYRNRVFTLLQQARALDVPQKDLAELRHEAVTCLGDFVGLAPRTFSGFPPNTTISKSRLHPTGRLAVFLLSDGTIRLREAPSGRGMGPLRSERPAWDFCFDKSGQRLASVHLASVDFPDPNRFVQQLSDARVCVWTPRASGPWIRASEAAVPGAFACLSAGDQLLVAAWNAGEGTVDLIELPSRRAVQRVPYPRGANLRPMSARPVASPDGQWLALPLFQQVEIWNLKTGQKAEVLEPEPRSFYLMRVEFSMDGRYLACVSAAGCSVYATNGFRHVATLAFRGAQFLNLAFGLGDKLALPLADQNRIRIWDAPGNADEAFLDLPFSPHQVDFSSDGHWLLASGMREARLFQLDPGAEKLNLRGHFGAVPGVCFSPDGSRVASVGKDRSLKVCDALSGQLLWEAGSLPGQGGQAVSYSADGRFLATGHWSSETLWLWDAQTGARLLELRTGNRATHTGYQWSVQFRPDGRGMVTAQDIPDPKTPEGIAVWELDSASSEKPAAKIARRVNGRIWGLTMASNGSRVAFLDVTAPVKLCVWDLSGDTAPRAVATDSLQSSQVVSFTPDARQLIYLSNQRELVTLDVATGMRLSSFPTLERGRIGGAAPQPNLCLSPDGTKLAVSSASRLSVDLWNPRNGERLYSLPGRNATVERLEWSPDSRRLAVACSDGEVAIWNLAEVEQVLAKLNLNP